MSQSNVPSFFLVQTALSIFGCLFSSQTNSRISAPSKDSVSEQYPSEMTEEEDGEEEETEEEEEEKEMEAEVENPENSTCTVL